MDKPHPKRYTNSVWEKPHLKLYTNGSVWNKQPVLAYGTPIVVRVGKIMDGRFISMGNGLTSPFVYSLA